jgi:DNA-binding response OmpR family regulator
MLLSGKFDAALLDILLPGTDGFEVLEQVRVGRCKTPILVLSTRNSCSANLWSCIVSRLGAHPH